MPALLFVYGTLKRGLSACRLLDGQEFLGEARTVPAYRLYDLGPHPALVADAARGQVVYGELWCVDDATLARLDEYEGPPNLFARQEIAVEGATGSVQAYLYQGDVSGLPECGERWP